MTTSNYALQPTAFGVDQSMTRVTKIISWTLLLAVLLAPFGYVLLGAPSGSFLDNVMGNLLATAAALVGGIPLALWLDRIIKSSEQREQQQSDRRRELELLELLREELAFCSNGLSLRREHPHTIQIQPLKSDLWSAISAAGKLNLIQNHRLLNRIASAYYIINIVRRVEEHAYRALRSATVRFDGGGTAVELLLEDARRFDELLDSSIREAVNDIDAETGKAI